jgi:hypothetical protein
MNYHSVEYCIVAVFLPTLWCMGCLGELENVYQALSIEKKVDL